MGPRFDPQSIETLSGSDTFRVTQIKLHNTLFFQTIPDQAKTLFTPRNKKYVFLYSQFSKRFFFLFPLSEVIKKEQRKTVTLNKNEKKKTNVTSKENLVPQTKEQTTACCFRTTHF